MAKRTTAPAKWTATPAKAAVPWRSWVSVILVGALLFLAGYLIGRPSSVQQDADQIRQADAARDKAQVADLTTLARTTRDQLMPVLTRMATAMPVDPAKAPQPAAAADVAGWQQAADKAVAAFADPPSGATATNVARGGFTAAVNQIGSAVKTYTLSLTADPAAQKELRELAGRQRTNAVATWSVASTQLDQVNIDAGYGHQHVFLPADPGSGAFTSDGSPEGSGSR
ncbi:hypothetical protein [Actinocrispum sp. NPDC049592]|uniref:hypothetical protein n=1 Tax=Actinocrispum sp. NPDC049592 TaxID=3154835 RepID=UPI003434AFB0